MPWWFWIILWSLLVIGSLGLLAWLLWKVLLRALASLEALGDWGNSVADSLDTHLQARPLEEAAPSALFTSPGQAYRDYVQGKNKRTLGRSARRVQRREELGQPQLLGDLRRLQER